MRYSLSLMAMVIVMAMTMNVAYADENGCDDDCNGMQFVHHQYVLFH